MTENTDLQALLRLMAWLSPAFPVGSFAYSGGLERAVEDGLVRDVASLRDWVSTLIARGTVWNDIVLLAAAHRAYADAEALGSVCELGEALAGSRERYQETTLLGDAFLTSARAWPDPVFDRLPRSVVYPIAVGAVAGAHGVSLEQVIAAFVHAYLSQAVSAGIRLGVAGQKDGVAVLAGLEADIAALAARGAVASLDDLGSATIQADIMSLRHETQQTRLFRS
ncbi:urease accessory protein UreF [Rhizobium grahamii]|uniref:Urease accessory protein UreF n=1 Tax=Rhizobium grahamii TaxID=1120045 RepID=A0A5Q0CAF0_9HYPH|nr:MULTISPECIES: urease accessory protein UreF [Rhizobium]QFY62433.1 urease accessory protein UreF [Rhizobium grahamii]QRM51380.1 urease accessory protein UreF [Rhizobium sp. BG6]